MRAPLLILPLTLALGACVVAPTPVRIGGPPVAYAAPPPVAFTDPYCREEAREARAAQAQANAERRDARYYGGRRQRYEAAAAQAEANRQRAQAERAC